MFGFRIIVSVTMLLLAWGNTAHGQTGTEGQTAGQAVGQAVVSLDGLTDPSRLYPGITYSTVADVATALGYGTQVILMEERHPVVVLEDERGLRIVAEAVMCEGTAPGDTCHALLLYTIFRVSAALRSSMIDVSNRYNEIQFYGRGHVTQGSDAIVSRLVIGEHGITRGHLATELFTMRIAIYNYARLLSDRGSKAALTVQSDSGPASSLRPFGDVGRATPFAARKPVKEGWPDIPGARDPGAGSLISEWQRLGLYEDFVIDPVRLIDGTLIDGTLAVGAE